MHCDGAVGQTRFTRSPVGHVFCLSVAWDVEDIAHADGQRSQQLPPLSFVDGSDAL